LRILLITQSEELYLPGALSTWFAELSDADTVVGCVLLSPAASGTGRKETLFSRAWDALTIFGFDFFVNIALRYVWRRLIKADTVCSIVESRGIPIIRLSGSINNAESLALIKNCGAEIFVSIQGNEIFKQPLLELAPCLNLHTAPLPKYRGLMPAFWAIHDQLDETAVSVFLVDEGIDSGPIYVQSSVKIKGLSLHEVIVRTKLKGMYAIHEALDLVRQGRDPEIINDASESSYFGFPTKLDVREFRRRGGVFFK